MAGVAAVLIAAGESVRMGAPKPLLPWLGDTLINYQVNSLREAGVSRTVVVLGRAADDVAPRLRESSDVTVLVNSRYREGKTTSIKLGVRETDPQAAALLLLAVDQPRPPALLRRIVEKHLAGQARITQPAYQGKAGHPLLFHPTLRDELLAITEERMGVRDVVGRDPARVARVAVDSPLVLLDLNTPEDYRRAVKMFEECPQPAETGGAFDLPSHQML